MVLQGFRCPRRRAHPHHLHREKRQPLLSGQTQTLECLKAPVFSQLLCCSLRKNQGTRLHCLNHCWNSFPAYQRKKVEQLMRVFRGSVHAFCPSYRPFTWRLECETAIPQKRNASPQSNDRVHCVFFSRDDTPHLMGPTCSRFA